MRLEIPDAEKRYRFHRGRTIAAERRLWGILRRFPLRVLRQHDIGDGFIADFAIVDARILVELDGPHDLKRQDAQVTSTYARRTRWRLIRLHADDVLEDLESVMALVKAEVAVAAPPAMIAVLIDTARVDADARDGPPCCWRARAGRTSSDREV